MLSWWTKDLHDTRKLLLLVFTREYGNTSVELGQITSQTPHIDRHTVCHSKDNFRGAIESRLDVCVDLLVLKTAGTEIDNLDFGMHWVGEQNIFGL